MKMLLRVIFLYLPSLVLALLLLIAGVIWQQELASRQDLEDLAGIVRNQGLQAAIDVVRVVRSNLDNRPGDAGITQRGHADGEIHTHRAGGLYDLVAADPETVHPVGEWNEATIRVQNNHIEHWLNGVKVVSIERGSERWQRAIANSKFADWMDYGMAAEGYIPLQDHGDPVWYRNIRIRRLPKH